MEALEADSDRMIERDGESVCRDAESGKSERVIRGVVSGYVCEEPSGTKYIYAHVTPLPLGKFSMKLSQREGRRQDMKEATRDRDMQRDTDTEIQRHRESDVRKRTDPLRYTH